MKIEFTPFADKMVEGDWRVEAINDEGEVYIAIFSGPECERLAHEYAAFKNGKHPAVKPEVISIPTAAPLLDKELHLTLENGEDISFRPDNFTWGINPRCKSGLIATPKPALKRREGKKGKE